MIKVYRVIEFSFQDDADLDYQLLKSVTNGVFKIGKEGKSEMKIKDRTDDPCEQGFFDDLLEYPGVMTEMQRRDYLPLQKEIES
jgi:hypothetical protein